MERQARLASVAAISGGAAVAALLAVTPAGAHTGASAGGLADGLLHPVAGPDHLLAMVAVGVLAVVTAAHRGWWAAPAAFLGGMVLGGVAALAGIPVPGAEVLIVVSVIALGIAVAGAVTRQNDLVLAGLVVAGVAHGHAHGAEVPGAANPALYVAGFVLATAALHLAGVGVGSVIGDRRTARLGFGAATASAGALLLMV